MKMTRFRIVELTAILLAETAFGASAQEFDWRAHEGETVTFLANSNTIGNLLIANEAAFEDKTGIDLVIDVYQEQQMRQRLMTVMNARSDEVDVFMTLPSREGKQFAAAGWYTDLSDYIAGDVAADYNADDFGKALVDAATFDGVLTGVPMNIEGPLLYYRKDLFEECGIALPDDLTKLPETAAALKECKPDITPFASRGLAAAAPYTFAGFLHNMGGSYIVDGKSALCSEAGKAAIGLYAELQQKYGPPGVVNYSFQQLTELYRAGRSAMSFESSNEFPLVMEGGARAEDTDIVVLPAGPGGSHPTVIGWALAISANAPNPDAAWYYLQWASSVEMQSKFALEGIAPPRDSVAESSEYKAWLDESDVRRQWQDALSQIASTGTSEIGYPIIGNPESRQYIGNAVGDVLLGTKTVEQSCADADAELDALIARE